MASLRFEDRIAVEADARSVWEYLIDPEKIVVCLPGAALDLIQNERTFLGKVRVRVGAVSVGYRGTIEFTELDHDQMRVRMVGKGRESGGAGSASMEMQSQVVGTSGGAEVIVQADVKLSGKIVRLGRGMIEGVAREILSEFGARLEERLAADGVESREPELDRSDAGTPKAAESVDSFSAPLPLLPLIWRAARSWFLRLLGK